MTYQNLTMNYYNKNTKMSEIEKKYGLDLGVRGDMELSEFLKEKGYPSLAKMLEDN
jgi:hypothetical protein